MRVLLALILGFFGLAFTAGGIQDLNKMSGWWPETLQPRVIDVNKIDVMAAIRSGNNWWLLKGGYLRFDQQTEVSTRWKHTDGAVTSLPELYYIPYSTCPTLPTDALKIVIAISADTYNMLRQSKDPFAFDRPHGLVNVIEHANPNIRATPPFLLMSFHSTLGQPKNPWIDLVIGVLLLTITAGLAVWTYYRP